MKQYLALAMVASVAVLCPSVSRAISVERSYLTHGVANCSPARWSFGESLRSAPIGLVNEGDATIFVTCDFDNVPNSLGTSPSEGYSTIAVAYLTQEQEPIQVSCTLINGILGAFRYQPKSTQTSNSWAVTLEWHMDVDNLENRYFAPVLSCAIPPKTTLTWVLGNYAEYIGR